MQSAGVLDTGLSVRYGGAVLAVGAATFIRWLLADLFGNRLTFITYSPVVAMVALAAGPGPTVLATILSAGIVSAWLMPALLASGDLEAATALCLFTLSGLILAIMAGMLQRARSGQSRVVRQLAESMHAQSERLRLAVDAAEAGIWSWDVASNVSDWDERYETLYGIHPGEPKSFDVWIGRVHEADRQRLLDRIQVLLGPGAGDSWREEFRARHPVKGERWMLGLGHVHRDAAGHALQFIGINIDITDRKQSEEAIRNSEQQFRAFLENSAVIAWLKDEEGRHVFLSENLQRRFGLKPSDWQGKTDFELWPAAQAKEYRRNDLAVLAGGTAMEVVEEAVNPDGSRSWWRSHKFPFQDASGKRYVGGLAVDITARKKAEAERQMFVSLADSSREFIGICRQDFTPIYLNAAGLQMVGLENFEEAYRTTALDFFFPEDQPIMTEEFLPRVMRNGHGEIEIRFRHFRTGEPIWMLHNVFNILDASGAAVGWATVSRNIHSRKMAEEQLQRLNRELEQRVAERTEALRDQQQRLQAILDTVASAIISLDRQGTIQSVNPAAERIFGFAAAEMLGQNISLLMPRADDDASLLQHLLVLSQAHALDGRHEMTARRQDGSLFPADLSITAVEQLQLYTVILRDITERKRAEQALQQRLAELAILNRVGLICSESRSEDELLYRATAVIAEGLYHDNCGFMLVDAARGRIVPHPSFVISDPNVPRMSFSLEEGITGLVARTGQALRVGDVSQHPAYLPADSRTRSELCVPIKIAGKVVGVVNVESQVVEGFSATDEQLMTTIVDLVGNALERFRSEEQLRRRERELADFVENATVGLHWVGPDGRILWANRAELDMLGYSRDEYIGRHVADFHTDPEVIADLLRRLLAKETVRNYEASLRCKDGSRRWVLIDSSVYVEDGRFVHSRCFIRDITERKNLEREVVEIATLEQERIGQDLHDDCGQELTALGLLADGLVESLQVHAPKDVALARKMQQQIKGVLRQVRGIARGLAQAEVEAEELPAALTELTARLAETSGVRCVFQGEEFIPRDGPTRATHLYHIAQEACTNALKHAHPGTSRFAFAHATVPSCWKSRMTGLAWAWMPRKAWGDVSCGTVPT
ncbi:MAG: PAS domain S-box protein [Planctomycetes bacterium]|nr:PAS domain S-box protein [Planctomycetota bacterium]